MAMEANQLGLSLTYSLHLLATVIWIGGLLYQTLFLLPTLRSNREPGMAGTLLERLRSRFQPVAWLSLAVLIGTGLIQMSAHPAYAGFLAIEGTWALAILAKHIAVALMLLVASYQSFILYPQLTRTLIKQRNTQAEQSGSKSLDRETRLLRINSLLSLLVLFLTAVARTA
jgi:uncharacterized membrane protein